MTDSAVERERAVSEAGLRFFGAMSASVSHEIRNKLAVINEKAGLLEDIAAAMRTGRMADPNRLEIQARKIVEQIREANRVVRALNRLAHSTDENEATVDLGELAALVVELYARAASTAQATIETRSPPGQVIVRTSPFLAASVIGRCLDAALAKIDPGGVIEVAVEAADFGARIIVSGLSGADLGEVLDPGFCGLDVLLDAVGADLGLGPNRDELVLHFKNLNAATAGVSNE